MKPQKSINMIIRENDYIQTQFPVGRYVNHTYREFKELIKPIAGKQFWNKIISGLMENQEYTLTTGTKYILIKNTSYE